MSASAEFSAALAASSLDPAAKAILQQFLTAGGPILDSLEAAALEDLLRWVAGAGPVPPPAVDALSAEGVAALLALTETQMAAALDARRQQAAAARAAVNALASAALGTLARLLLTAL
jgi:hypothetical protein